MRFILYALISGQSSIRVIVGSNKHVQLASRNQRGKIDNRYVLIVLTVLFSIIQEVLSVTV